MSHSRKDELFPDERVLIMCERNSIRREEYFVALFLQGYTSCLLENLFCEYGSLGSC